LISRLEKQQEQLKGFILKVCKKYEAWLKLLRSHEWSSQLTMQENVQQDKLISRLEKQ
jgi:hypothetical protein